MTQATTTKKYPDNVLATRQALEEFVDECRHEWQAGDVIPSVEVTDELFKSYCKDDRSTDCFSFSGTPSMAKDPSSLGKFPGVFVYRFGRRAEAEQERNLPLDAFHIKKVTEERERRVKAEELKKAKARK